ncbi:MAG: methylmalonyl-CoA epimerase [Herminiimonas sp.]|nr:methylmalonyl-CoA epimerase [Herminiimonas sp.]
MLDRLSHVSIVVPDLEAAAERLAHAYGMVAGEILVNHEQGVRITYVTLANAKIELMQPLAMETPLGRFLQRNPGGGLHHISFAVDSVAEVSATLENSGVKTIGSATAKNVHGEPITFIHPKEFLGVLVELEEKPSALPHDPN